MSGVVVAVGALFTPFKLHAVDVHVAVLRPPAGAHDVDARFLHGIIAFRGGMALPSACGNPHEIPSARPFRHLTEPCPHFIQVVGVHGQVHAFVHRSIAAPGREVISIRVPDHGSGKIGLQLPEDEFACAGDGFPGIRRYGNAVQLAQVHTLEIADSRYHVVDAGALHVYAIVIEGIAHFMHHPLVAVAEPGLPFVQFGEQDGGLQQRPGFHGEPVGAFFVIGIMIHQEISVDFHRVQVQRPAFPVKCGALAQRTQAGKECGVQPHGGFNVPPGIAGILVKLDVRFLVPQKVLDWPGVQKAPQQGKGFPGIAFVPGFGVGPGQRLPEDEAVQAPAPFVVVGGMIGGVKVPVHFSRKGIPVQRMAHHFFRIRDEARILVFAKIVNVKQIPRLFAGAEMAYDLFRTACFIALRQPFLGPRHTGMG